jgi:propanediol dehydratase large subunit
LTMSAAHCAKVAGRAGIDVHTGREESDSALYMPARALYINHAVKLSTKS